MDCFICAAYCGGKPGIVMSSMVTFDCHSPDSTIRPLSMRPDCLTAWLTWFPVAFLRLTCGPLLHEPIIAAQAIRTRNCFIEAPLFGGRSIAEIGGNSEVARQLIPDRLPMRRS